MLTEENVKPPKQIKATIAIAAGDGLERGEDGVPTAFRIWTAGPNPTDHGLHLFTAASADALMDNQYLRGNMYSIDVDHMSLSMDAPPEHHKAVGWHRLAVRDGDLWAVDVEWSPSVAAGLTAEPPEWRYFSPAYNVDPETGEIVGYLNTALTNNPATWSVTALATAAATTATKKESAMDNMKAAVTAAMSDDEEEKKAGMDWLKKAAAEGDKKCAAICAAFGDEPDGDEPKHAEPDGDEAKKEASIAATITRLESTERRLILATRKDLTASQIAAVASVPNAQLETVLAAIPVNTNNAAAAAQPAVQATVGRSDVGHPVQAKSQSEEIAERMGLKTKTASISFGFDAEEGSLTQRLPILTRAEAKAIQASRNGGVK